MEKTLSMLEKPAGGTARQPSAGFFIALT